MAVQSGLITAVGNDENNMKAAVTRRGKKAVVNIASGQTVSTEAVDARGFGSFAMSLPAALTGTAITFQVSHDGTAFQPLYNTANTLISITVAVNRAYTLPADLAPWPYFKLVSGSAEGAARAITVVAIS